MCRKPCSIICSKWTWPPGEYRQLTRGKYDDFDGNYLPAGDVLFLSTRKGQFLQTSETNTQQTIAGDLPDSYVRCGGDDYRPVPVFTMHAVNQDGTRIWPVSAFETFEYTPSIAHDGRILYCRWDYIDRFNGHFFSLWSSNPDGTNAQLVYGNYHGEAAGDRGAAVDSEFQQDPLHRGRAPLDHRRIAGALGSDQRERTRGAAHAFDPRSPVS